MPAGPRGDWVRGLSPGEGAIAKWEAESYWWVTVFLSSSLSLLYGIGSRATRSSHTSRKTLNTWLFCVIVWLSYVDPILGKINTKHSAKPNQAWLWEMTVPAAAVSSLCALPVAAGIREDHWMESQDLCCLLGAAGWGCFCGDVTPCWDEHSHVSLTWQLSRTTINVSLGLRVLDKKTLRWSLQCIQNSKAMKALAGLCSPPSAVTS